MRYGLHAATLADAEVALRAHRPFRLRDGRSLRGTTDAPTYFGRIPARHSVGAESADYWVFSYDTLIGWMTDGEPTVPDVGYSLTTGQHQHQHLVAAAWGIDFRPARGRDTVEIPRNDSLYGRPRRLRSGGMDGARPEPEEARVSAYAGTSGDAMHWDDRLRDQDALISEVQGWRPSHP